MVFLIDVSARRIVGWRVSSSMATASVLDALAEKTGHLLDADMQRRYNRAVAAEALRQKRQAEQQRPAYTSRYAAPSCLLSSSRRLRSRCQTGACVGISAASRVPASRTLSTAI